MSHVHITKVHVVVNSHTTIAPHFFSHTAQGIAGLKTTVHLCIKKQTQWLAAC